jgi:hypothetical protein
MVFSKNVAELHHKLKKYSSKSYFSIKKSDTLGALLWKASAKTVYSCTTPIGASTSAAVSGFFLEQRKCERTMLWKMKTGFTSVTKAIAGNRE